MAYTARSGHDDEFTSLGRLRVTAGKMHNDGCDQGDKGRDDEK